MNISIAFAPLIPTALLWSALALVIVLAIVVLFARTPGGALRVAALAMIVLALANPSFTREEREPLPSVAALIIDRSPSQGFAARTQETDAARDALLARMKALRGVEVRVVEAGQADGETDGTRLFSALASAFSDVPPERVAGAIMISDGRVHDIPANAAALGLKAPLHALITGTNDERDRRVAIVAAPRFSIVGQTQTISYRVDDQNIPAGEARIVVRRDGEEIDRRVVRPGQTNIVDVKVPHAGTNIVEIEVAGVAGELTLVNNRAVVTIDGLRDKLRVLLVSGEPHAGERTWRNLLKSDPSVDLVHFTILRPPEKQDGTPIHELSLIAFPTRELFQQKINEFQLIIFDRYARQGVLPSIYFDNIARYVRRGGAVLVASGPDYASATSLWRTPLDSVLPAEPSGVIEKAFHARLSEAGKRHPVTRGLNGADANPPHWSEFFRLVDTRNLAASASTIMEGADGKPLLLLSRYDEGRVALLLSDHIWLWARGHDGGGPHLDLLRRLSHWLMKQPELEEEALTLVVEGADLVVRRQTMADKTAPVTVTSPDGKTRDITLRQDAPGLWTLRIRADQLGLWAASDGTLKTLVNVGPANPREFSEVTSTMDALLPIARASGGDARRLIASTGMSLPRIEAVRSGTSFHGEGWLGLSMREASVVRGIGAFPVFAGLLGLLLLIGALTTTWLREGR
jgi:hypothetical protein